MHSKKERSQRESTWKSTHEFDMDTSHTPTHTHLHNPYPILLSSRVSLHTLGNVVWSRFITRCKMMDIVELKQSWQLGQQQSWQQSGANDTKTSILHPSTSLSISSLMLTWFLSLATLKRSKSDKEVRVWRVASFWAQALLLHLAITSSFSKYFLRVVWPALRGKPLTTMLVKIIRSKARAWRATPVVGPSTRAYHVCIFIRLCIVLWRRGSSSV